MRRERSTLVVRIDLDPVPGWGNSPDDHRALVQRLLDDAVGHYNPTVEVVQPATYDAGAVDCETAVIAGVLGLSSLLLTGAALLGWAG